jgi:hypothetical protein
MKTYKTKINKQIFNQVKMLLDTGKKASALSKVFGISEAYIGQIKNSNDYDDFVYRRSHLFQAGIHLFKGKGKMNEEEPIEETRPIEHTEPKVEEQVVSVGQGILASLLRIADSLEKLEQHTKKEADIAEEKIRYAQERNEEYRNRRYPPTAQYDRQY